MKYIGKFHPVLECEYCGKEITKQNYRRHIGKCDKNPEIIDSRKKQVRQCEQCDKEYTLYDNDSERFCSKSCSARYATISIDHNELKLASCIDCGNEVYIKKCASARRAKCDDCKVKNKREKKLKYNRDFRKECLYCGRRIENPGSLVIHERSCKENPERKDITYNYKRVDIREGYIYLTRNKKNGKVYVGKHKGKPEDSTTYFGSGVALKRAIKKHGKDSFEKFILEYTEDGDLNELERVWISEYNSNQTGVGYNLSEGGDGGPLFKGKKHSDEVRLKISEKMKGRNKKTEG